MKKAIRNRYHARVEGQSRVLTVRFFALVCAVLVAMLALAACTDSGPSASLVPTPTPTSAQANSTPTDFISDEPAPENTSTPQPPTQEVEATTVPSPVAEVTPVTPATPATSAALPDGPITVVALGDSLTEGDGDDWQRGGYPSRVAEMINKQRPGSSMTNLGKSGWTSAQMLAEQLPAALEAKPNIALVWIGSNDLWQFNAAEEEESDLKNYTANIDTTLRELKGAGASIFIALLDDQSLRPFAQPENGYFDTEGLARMSRRITAYNKVIAAKAAEYGAVTVDFFHTTLFTDPATLADDGLHPNPPGYDIVAQIWFNALSGIL